MVIAATDYEVELRRLDAMAERLAAERLTDGGASSAARHAACLFQRALLTGCVDDCDAVVRLVEAALALHPAWPDLWLLKAKVDFHLHRYLGAQRALGELAHLADCREREAMEADIDLEEGRVAKAERVYQRHAVEDPSWTNFWRLATCEARQGRLEAARALLARAADEITAKEMRTFAWLQVQWGDIERDAGRTAEARRRYELADAAFGGYWLVEERMEETIQ